MPDVAAVSKPGVQAGVAEWLAYADQLVQTQQYEYLGKMKVIVLEAARAANVPGLAETTKVGVRLDWRNEEHPSGKGMLENYIRIAQAFDRKTLLCLDPIVRRDGQIGLPDIPDPGWKPGQPGKLQTSGKFKGQYIATEDDVNEFNPGRPPMIKQELVDRASGRVEHTNLLVFQPVHQVMFQPEINGALQATYWTLECGHDPANRTQVAFLVDAKNGRGYFYGGRYIISPVG